MSVDAVALCSRLKRPQEAQDPRPDQRWTRHRRHLLQDVSNSGLHRDRVLCRHIQRAGQGKDSLSLLVVTEVNSPAPVFNGNVVIIRKGFRVRMVRRSSSDLSDGLF